MKVQKCRLQSEIFEVIRIRQTVFHQEMNIDYDYLSDTDDNNAIHYLLYDNNKAIGTLRVVIKDKKAQIGRFALLKEYRKQDKGSFLLQEVEKDLKKYYIKYVFLEAQSYISSFYQKNGYRIDGKEFIKANIKHVKMIKEIDYASK